MKLTATITLLSLVACSQQQSGDKEFKKSLTLGRKVSYAASGTDSTFSLSDGSEIAQKTRDSQTNAVVSIAFDTTAQDPVDYYEADRHCLDSATVLAAEFLIERSELSPNSNMLQRISPELIAVTYNRNISGVPVRDAFFQCIYADYSNGVLKLREVINRTYGGLPMENSATDKVNFAVLAESTGRQLKLQSKVAVIFPKLEASGDISLWHATEFTAEDGQSGELLTITAASDNGEILEAYSNTYAASYAVKGDTFDRTYLNSARAPTQLPLLEVLDGTASQRADIDGEITSDNLGNTLTVKLQSPRVQVIDVLANNGLAMIIPAIANGDNEIRLNANANGLIGVSAYSSTMRINEFVRRHLEPGQAVILNQTITVSINVAGSCNAFYNGNISMFRAGGNCENTALINDIIYHEWGHGLDDDTGTNRGITDGAFSEGIGDILTAYYTNDSNLAPGFIAGRLEGIRNLKNTRRYPNDRGEVHVEGQIIGGAFWDMRAELIKRYGAEKGAYHAETLFFKHILTTDSYLDSYAAVLRLDDDDNNPATKSPNHCLINAAFAAHGIATAENCTDSPAKDTYESTGLTLALVSGNDSYFMASGKDIHYMHVCYGDKLACVLNGKVDVALSRSGVIGDLNVFAADQNLSLTANSLVTLIGSDAYGQITKARTFKVVNR